MKGKLKHMPKFRWVSSPTSDIAVSANYSLVWVENTVFNVENLAYFLNDSHWFGLRKCERVGLFEVPEINTDIDGISYTLYVFEQF